MKVKVKLGGRIEGKKGRVFNAESQRRRVRREDREFSHKEYKGHKVVSGYNWVL